MEKIQNYKIIETLTETRGSMIYRARKEGESDTVILKALKAEYPTASEVARFKQEYKLIKDIDLKGVIKVHEIVDHKGSFALVIEDFNGVSIKSLIGNKKKFEIKSFLRTAIKIADALGNLHKEEIVHRDIKPHNILINPKNGVVKISDFGISSEITHENDEIYNPDVIEGSLAYLSPEQTGRMNRTVDYRTDIYSLGVTLYEMLTGSLPFISDDPMAVIHSHIAIMPAHPKENNAKIPDMVSEIVMKLLSKNTEDRYQNCFGLMADLEECLEQYTKNGSIDSFELGKLDISDKFFIPEKLFGREKEINTLVSGFEELCNLSEAYVSGKDNRGVKIMLVAGDSGIGKSALINEINKPLIASKGYFISGKYDQFRRDKPYSALIQGFQGLVKQILAESNEKLEILKEKMQVALGPNGKVITDIVPEIEHIIGKQPELAELGPMESRNRFNYVFEKFASVFASAEHPVALFLDDLQWVDLPSIELIQNLVTSGALQYLYVIGSYRTEDVDLTHPLAELIGNIKAAGISVNWINLGPILEHDIKNIIINFLKCEDNYAALLAGIVYDKTGGNPFFVIQFLETLHDENLIEFDAGTGWVWDIERINQLQVTDNVVELMVDKINRLPEKIQEVLKVCAAIGNRFDLETLSFILDTSLGEALDNLAETISDGFISLSIEKELYIFNHDRIQEAAYSLVSDVEKPELHYRIGKKALDMASDGDDLEKKLFYIVDQLNLAPGLIHDAKEREELARLNLDAGIKAKTSSAFSPAIRYLETGIGLLDKNCWKKQYKLTLSLYTEITESAYLDGDYDKMEKLSETALQRTRSTKDKVKIISSRIYANTSQEKYQAAIDSGLPILKQLGIRIPKKPGRIKVGIQLLKVRIALLGKKKEDLLNLPEGADNKVSGGLKILASMGVSAFFVDPNLFAMVVLRGVRLGIRHGIISDHAFAFAGYGITLSAGLWQFDAGIAFGKLGLELIDKLGAREQLCRTNFVHYGILQHWKTPLIDTIAPLMEGYRSGLETGDLDFAAFNLFMADMHSTLSGKGLSDIESDLSKHNQIIKGLNQKYMLTLSSINWQFVLNLLGQSDDPLMLTGKAIEGEKALPDWTRDNNRVALAAFYFIRLSIRAIYSEYSLTLEDSKMYKKYMEAVQGVVINRHFVAIDSLSRLMLYPGASFFKKIKYRIQIKINQIKQKKWAENAPGNCMHQFLGVEALRSWHIRKDIDRAKKEIEQVHALFKRPDDLPIEAFVDELFARFYISIGDEDKAKEQMIATYNAYSSWGALDMLKQLRKKYPELLAEQIQAVSRSSSSDDTTTTISNSLDFSTSMKAAQTISGEIVLEKLLLRMIEIVLENAGADKGFILLKDKDKFLVEAEKVVGKEEISVLKSIPLDSHEGISSNIVNFVARTEETLILNDAAGDGAFTNDPYVITNRPKSILCVPILHQKRMLGVLYLENNLSTGAFTPARLEFLDVISSQIAISIDNAKLYENLEEKVVERTEDLQEAMEELEITNTSLKEAQRIAQADMNMAANVQASLFPKQAPENPEWDIAFAFKPMSGVSGDLYDFYSDNGGLRGLTLLDVSGHGIASGLITMIARSVFDRNFKAGLNDELNHVVERANKELISEKGNVDNFLTGILLRFNGKSVEYVNAGHTDLICKRASSGEAEIINLKNRDFKGLFLGIEAMDNPFEVLKFDVSMDDTLLLYTDCLNESTNSEDEEYTAERIILTLSNAPNDTSQSILDFLLDDFYSFMKDKPVDDDLAVIVAKRKL